MNLTPKEMIAMRKHKNFWDKNAGRYDRFMRKDRAAYNEMYELIRPEVKAKMVLEAKVGTVGLSPSMKIQVWLEHLKPSQS